MLHIQRVEPTWDRKPTQLSFQGSERLASGRSLGLGHRRGFGASRLNWKSRSQTSGERKSAQGISPACGALSACTTPQPSQNLVEPSWNHGGTLVEAWWKPVEAWWNPRGTLPRTRPGPTRSLSGLRPQSFQLLGKKRTSATSNLLEGNYHSTRYEKIARKNHSTNQKDIQKAKGPYGWEPLCVVSAFVVPLGSPSSRTLFRQPQKRMSHIGHGSVSKGTRGGKKTESSSFPFVLNLMQLTEAGTSF